MAPVPPASIQHKAWRVTLEKYKNICHKIVPSFTFLANAQSKAEECAEKAPGSEAGLIFQEESVQHMAVNAIYKATAL